MARASSPSAKTSRNAPLCHAGPPETHQNTQNRDSRALHLKLDELIKATARARNSIIDVANLSEEQLKRLEEEYKKLCTQAAQMQEQKQEKKG
jgi:low affinity Fe/Cu permease